MFRCTKPVHFLWRAETTVLDERVLSVESLILQMFSHLFLSSLVACFELSIFASSLWNNWSLVVVMVVPVVMHFCGLASGLHQARVFRRWGYLSIAPGGFGVFFGGPLCTSQQLLDVHGHVILDWISFDAMIFLWYLTPSLDFFCKIKMAQFETILSWVTGAGNCRQSLRRNKKATRFDNGRSTVGDIIGDPQKF